MKAVVTRGFGNGTQISLDIGGTAIGYVATRGFYRFTQSGPPSGSVDTDRIDLLGHAVFPDAVEKCAVFPGDIARSVKFRGDIAARVRFYGC